MECDDEILLLPRIIIDSAFVFDNWYCYSTDRTGRIRIGTRQLYGQYMYTIYDPEHMQQQYEQYPRETLEDIPRQPQIHPISLRKEYDG
mmetsp:Transcript_15955/g.17235  ORF Transcript_15955/g.17235 Transcript_15955/m.17235 type:complete len:89 (-) Transcript_15955:72-338(-)